MGYDKWAVCSLTIKVINLITTCCGVKALRTAGEFGHILIVVNMSSEAFKLQCVNVFNVLHMCCRCFIAFLSESHCTFLLYPWQICDRKLNFNGLPMHHSGPENAPVLVFPMQHSVTVSGLRAAMQAFCWYFS